MKDVLLSTRITVTLRAGEWYWLLGLLAALGDVQNSTIDKIIDQVYQATD